MSNNTTTSHTLAVPGACLHYDVNGTGPVLLLIPGGAADSSMFAGLAPLLADIRTVVTYDPRGISRSTIDDTDEQVRIETQSDDGCRILAAVGASDEPVDVFGNSGGAITGLDLVARHPDRVRTLVAHEPPITELLSEAAQYREFRAQLRVIYARDGVEAAMNKFIGDTGLDRGDGPPPAEALADMMPNFDLFFGRMQDPIGEFRPDLAALISSPTRVVVAAGVDTAAAGQITHRTSVALAQALGSVVIDVPGDHVGFVNEPDAFAAVLREVLDHRGGEALSPTPNP